MKKILITNVIMINYYALLIRQEFSPCREWIVARYHHGEQRPICDVGTVGLKISHKHKKNNFIMLNFPFQNQAEFNDIFCLRETGGGKLVRRNKILLTMLKNRECHKIFKWLKNTKSTGAIFKELLLDLSNYSIGNYCIYITYKGCIYIFHNLSYQADHDVICEDLDENSYRYKKDGKIYKMKIGKLFSKVLEGNPFWTILPEQVKIYFLEEVTKLWKSQNIDYKERYSLYFNKEFSKIYSSYYCAGDFCSCMTDRGREDFYIKSIKAHAAYICDKNFEDKIVARCIVYDEVHGYGEKPLRLAERQYSLKQSDLLKQILIQKLIDAGHIDGYKKIGVDCHANNAFLLNDGTDLSEENLWIENNINPYDDILSYQDSFIYLDDQNYKAYNKSIPCCIYQLDTTDEYLDGYYDDYHEEYCRETCTVYFRGEEITCDVDRLDDFICYNNEYYHQEDFFICARCGEGFLRPDYYNNSTYHYSEITNEDYCCELCKNEAEEEYKKDNWFYSSIDCEYFEDEDDVLEINVWDETRHFYTKETISKESLEKEDYIIFEGDLYIGYNNKECKPYEK